MSSPQQVYAWVRETRAVMFRYCEDLPAPVYRRELADAGLGSLRNLHLHSAESYLYWLGPCLTGQASRALAPPDHPDVAAVRRAFAAVDTVVAEFLDRFADRWQAPLTMPGPGPLPRNLTPLWIFTRSVTHEFHHNGQMTALGRRMGYAPPPLDLVTP